MSEEHTWVWFMSTSFSLSERTLEVLPVTVDSIRASPAATTPALKSTYRLDTLSKQATGEVHDLRVEPECIAESVEEGLPIDHIRDPVISVGRDRCPIERGGNAYEPREHAYRAVTTDAIVKYRVSHSPSGLPKPSVEAYTPDLSTKRITVPWSATLLSVSL